MISKEVISKTQKKLIKINMLVVFGFLILLCIFTYIYFGYTNDNNINNTIDNNSNNDRKSSDTESQQTDSEQDDQ